MKPTIQFNEKSRGDFSECESRRGSTLPKTDYSFQPASIAKAGSRCFGSCRQSFRGISRNYFENEAPRIFASEAILFGVIAMTAAIPILHNMSALTNFVRSIGAF